MELFNCSSSHNSRRGVPMRYCTTGPGHGNPRPVLSLHVTSAGLPTLHQYQPATPPHHPSGTTPPHYPCPHYLLRHYTATLPAPHDTTLVGRYGRLAGATAEALLRLWTKRRRRPGRNWRRWRQRRWRWRRWRRRWWRRRRWRWRRRRR